MLQRSAASYLRLNPADDVVIACRELEAGTNLLKEDVVVQRAHSRRATRWPRARSRPDEPVRRYNQIIGFATRPIAPGEHVHVHNLEVRDFARDYAFGEAVRADAVRDHAGHLPGHRARRRARGDAQLHRHPRRP